MRSRGRGGDWRRTGRPLASRGSGVSSMLPAWRQRSACLAVLGSRHVCCLFVTPTCEASRDKCLGGHVVGAPVHV